MDAKDQGITKQEAIPLLSSTGFMLHKVGMLLIAAAEESLAAHGMRLRYFYVLAALQNSDEFSQQDLSAMLGVDPTSMVTVIDEMEAKGHALRRRNPADRRRYIVQLTDEGRTALAAASESVLQLERDFLSDLSADAQESLHTVLSQLMSGRTAEAVDCD